MTQIIAELPAVVEALTGMKLDELRRRVPGFGEGDEQDADAKGDAEEIG